MQVLTKASNEQVRALEHVRPDQITSELIEQHHVDFLGCLPVEAWFRLVTPDLSPAAAAILFRHNLRADAAGKPVLEALVAGNWFAKSECGQLLVQQLAAVPEHKLAGILDTISELDRSLAQHTLPQILTCAQRLVTSLQSAVFRGRSAW